MSSDLTWGAALTNVQPVQGIQALPPGTYRFRVNSAQGKTSNPGSTMIAVQLEVVSAAHNGRKVYHNFIFPNGQNDTDPDKARERYGRLLGDFLAFGVTGEYLTQNLGQNPINEQTAEWVGQHFVNQTCKAVVTLQKDDQTRNNVNRFAVDDGIEPPAPSSAPTGPGKPPSIPGAMPSPAMPGVGGPGMGGFAQPGGLPPGMGGQPPAPGGFQPPAGGQPPMQQPQFQPPAQPMQQPQFQPPQASPPQAPPGPSPAGPPPQWAQPTPTGPDPAAGGPQGVAGLPPQPQPGFVPPQAPPGAPQGFPGAQGAPQGFQPPQMPGGAPPAAPGGFQPPQGPPAGAPGLPMPGPQF